MTSRGQQQDAMVRRRGKRGLPRVRINVPWRLVSLILALALAGAGAFMFLSPLFYVTSVEIGGNRTIPPEEIFAETEIADLHILWVQPEEVAARIAELPSIAEAEVYIYWPSRVVILVRERTPALVWQQGENRFWVDVNGRLMRYRADDPALLTIVNEDDAVPLRCPGPGCPEEIRDVMLDAQVVGGAQQLYSLRPELTVLYYDQTRGLSFEDPRGWRGVFGTGVDMDVKLVVYEQVIGDLLAQGISPTLVDVSIPDAPYYDTE